MSASGPGPGSVASSAAPAINDVVMTDFPLAQSAQTSASSSRVTNREASRANARVHHQPPDDAADGDDGHVGDHHDPNDDPDPDADLDADADGEGESDNAADGSGDASSSSTQLARSNLLQIIQTLTTLLCSAKDDDGDELALPFQRLPNKRNLPDYFEIITTPTAFSTIRSKFLRKSYTQFSQFVLDVAQIFHNAQVYNRPSAPVFRAAVRLRNLFRLEIAKLIQQGQITAQDGELPDLGEIPTEESPLPHDGRVNGDGDGDGEDDDDENDDDDDDDDESDEETTSHRRTVARQRGRVDSTGPVGAVKRDRADTKDDDLYKRRGRPPNLATPHEARIWAVIRGLRRYKNDQGDLLVGPFDKLPDRAINPDYYDVISSPIALDQIKRKAKRKRYHSLDGLLVDLDMMFENAKRYNEDGSMVFTAAVKLQTQARALAQAEKAKSDDVYRIDKDGKLPLTELQQANGQTWRVGDWVHVKNANDARKPIVAQIFRLWKDRAGLPWVNACWYYRPEQTVHRFEKHFYEHEVVKTGQYRDHPADELLDRCFVMFVTRFPKGRPRGLAPTAEVYVCEYRYNEDRATFNRIKTWTSCLPDEVRGRDYEMDLFEAPRRMRKVPSPIKHLLRDDARESDELPRPTWGHANAPPIVGAVHRRPREPNESPPPELITSTLQPLVSVQQQLSRYPMVGIPMLQHQYGLPTVHPSPMPSPMPVPVPVPMPYTPRMPAAAPMPPGIRGQGHAHMSPPASQPLPTIPHPHHIPPSAPTPSSTLSSTLGHQPAFRLIHPGILQQPLPIQQQLGLPPPPPNRLQSFPPVHNLPGSGASPYAPQQPSGSPPKMTSIPMPGLVPPPAAPSSIPHASGVANGAQRIAMAGPLRIPPPVYHAPPGHARGSDVYVLSDKVNEAIPEEVRSLLHRDDHGRVLFFHHPPVCRPPPGSASDSTVLGHSIRWLADRKRRAEADSLVIAAPKRPAPTLAPAAAREADVDPSRVLSRVFAAFDEDTQAWRDKAGLASWADAMAPVRASKARREAARGEAARRALAERRAAMRERAPERARY